jgi:large subunit ribosomal protein L19
VNVIKELEKKYSLPPKTDFQVGDTIRVEFKIVEGDKERVQPFEGVVIARRHSGARETFVVRRIASGVGVERTFPINSPRIVDIKITRRGQVRRSKLYYLRRKTGKAARIREGIQTSVSEEAETPNEAPAENGGETKA